MEFKVNADTYVLTDHAIKRMKSRGLGIKDIIEALSNIKVRRVANSSKGEGERYLIGGRNKVSMIVSIDNVIITVYNYQKEYNDNRSKNRFNKKRRDLKKRYGNRIKR